MLSFIYMHQQLYFHEIYNWLDPTYPLYVAYWHIWVLKDGEYAYPLTTSTHLIGEVLVIPWLLFKKLYSEDKNSEMDKVGNSTSIHIHHA